MSSVVIWCHLLSSVLICCHLMSSDYNWTHLLSSDVIWCHLVSGDVILCHLMSSVVIWCHLLSSDVICCHLLSLAVICYHRLSSDVTITSSYYFITFWCLGGGSMEHKEGVLWQPWGVVEGSSPLKIKVDSNYLQWPENRLNYFYFLSQTMQNEPFATNIWAFWHPPTPPPLYFEGWRGHSAPPPQ